MHQRGNALDGIAIGEMLVEIVHSGLEIFVGADDRGRTVGISPCAPNVLFLLFFSWCEISDCFSLLGQIAFYLTCYETCYETWQREWVVGFMNYCERSVYVTCLAILLLPGAGYAEESAFIVKREGDRIALTRASDKVTLVTQHAGAEMRPYLHPILAPNGKGELTEFSPGHHKHQTGLYWGFTRVNGRDYFHNNKGDSWLRKHAHPRNPGQPSKMASCL